MHLHHVCQTFESRIHNKSFIILIDIKIESKKYFITLRYVKFAKNIKYLIGQIVMKQKIIF